MDCDICFICHSHIDFARLDEAYPHLAEDFDYLPPEGLSVLEENIYWGVICHECAGSAEHEPPDRPRFRSPPAV